MLYRLVELAKDARESAEEIDRVESRIEEAVSERKLLLGELSHLSRQEWIEEYARNELGMAPPRADQFIREEDLPHILGPVDSAPPEAGEVSDD